MCSFLQKYREYLIIKFWIFTIVFVCVLIISISNQETRRCSFYNTTLFSKKTFYQELSGFEEPT